MPKQQPKSYSPNVIDAAKKALDSIADKFKGKPEQVSVTVTNPQEQEFSRYSKGQGYKIPKDATKAELMEITNRLLQTERKKTFYEDLNEKERAKQVPLAPANTQVVDVRLVLGRK